MSQSSGAYGEADATEQKNEQHNNQPANSASTDATLNARAKSPKSKGPNKWIIAIIAVIAVVAIIVGVVVFRNNNASSDTAENGASNTVTIGLKLAPVSLDIRHQSGSAIEQVLIGNVYEGLLSRDSDNKVQPGLAKSWLYNFFLTEPRLTFHAYDPGYQVTFALMLTSAIITCTLTTRLKDHAKMSAQAAFRTKNTL